MRNLTVILCLTLTLLLGSVGKSFALPPCPSDQNQRYHNCFGTVTYANEDKYVGEFRDAKRNGQGTYYYLADNQFKGDKYVGEFKDDEHNGQGTYTYANGNKYVGEYRDGKRNGQGTYYYLADNQFKGDKYVGEYRDDKKNGQGTYTRANGQIIEGIFENGQFKYAQKGSPPVVTARKSSPPSSSAAEIEVQKLQKRIAELEKQNKSKPKQVARMSSPLVMYHLVVEFLAPAGACLKTDEAGYDCTVSAKYL